MGLRGLTGLKYPLSPFRPFSPFRPLQPCQVLVQRQTDDKKAHLSRRHPSGRGHCPLVASTGRSRSYQPTARRAGSRGRSSGPRDRRAGVGAHLLTSLPRRGYGWLRRARRRHPRSDRNLAGAPPGGHPGHPCGHRRPVAPRHERGHQNRRHATHRRSSKHGSRITHHGSRITDHASRITQIADRDPGFCHPLATRAGHGRGHGGQRVGIAGQSQAAASGPGSHCRQRAHDGQRAAQAPRRHPAHGHGVGAAGP